MFKLITFAFLICFSFFARAAPFGKNELTPEQTEILEDRITKLVALKFPDEDLERLTVEEIMEAINEAYDKEIAAIEEEKNVKVDELPIDMEKYKEILEEEVKKFGGDDAVVKQTLKMVELLAIKFYDQDYESLSNDDYFEAIIEALDKEIAYLEYQ